MLEPIEGPKDFEIGSKKQNSIDYQKRNRAISQLRWELHASGQRGSYALYVGIDQVIHVPAVVLNFAVFDAMESTQTRAVSNLWRRNVQHYRYKNGLDKIKLFH